LKLYHHFSCISGPPFYIPKLLVKFMTVNAGKWSNF
jgi:hypothetical protein